MNLQGLNKQQVEESRQKHGANTLTQIPPEPLWKKILEGFKDTMIMILLVALVITLLNRAVTALETRLVRWH